MTMAALGVEESEKISWWGMRPKRTQARPKHSLFGTCMESVNTSDLEGTQGRYIPEGNIKPKINRYPLPSHLQDQLTGRFHVESSQQEMIHQKNVVAEIDERLREKSKGAFSFKPTQQGPVPTSDNSHSVASRPSWLSEADIKHAKDINILGLNERGSYNRDKYGQKPKRHNYSLIGDLLAKNMDLKTSTRELHENAEISNQYRDRRRNHRDKLQIKIDESPTIRQKKSKSLVELPANIRHKFGSRVCDNLLSDQELVDTALEKQRIFSGPARPSKKENVAGLPVDLQGNYESLGQAMRYNTFPGLTTEHTISRTKDDFNDTVHLRRDPNPDEHRYQRDELSTWSEHNVLRDRMKKAWKEAYPLGGKKL